MAHQLVDGFRSVGVDVWWDEDMPGIDWQEELERRITDLSIVIVLWTEHSSGSKNVRDEARLGLKSDKLLNLLCGVVEPPFPFDRVNGLPLDGWDGVRPHRGWTRAVETVERLMVAEGYAVAGEITGKLTSREQTLRDARSALDRAKAGFAEAQATQADADKASTAAEEALTRARSDLTRSEGLGLGPAIVRAAQLEFDAAIARNDEADRTRRTAEEELSNASRELSQCREDENALSVPAWRPASLARVSYSQSQGLGSAVNARVTTSESGETKPFRIALRVPRVVSRATGIAAGVLLVVFVALRLTLYISGSDSLRSVRALMPSEPLYLERNALYDGAAGRATA